MNNITLVLYSGLVSEAVLLSVLSDTLDKEFRAAACRRVGSSKRDA